MHCLVRLMTQVKNNKIQQRAMFDKKKYFQKSITQWIVKPLKKYGFKRYNPNNVTQVINLQMTEKFSEPANSYPMQSLHVMMRRYLGIQNSQHTLHQRV